MADEPRYIPPDSLVEITMVILQNRYLLRPSTELNDIVLGVFGLAQKMYDMRVCGVTVASTHYHLLLVPRDAHHMAEFMRFVNGNLSKEVDLLHDWPGKLWNDRYHHVLVSDEEKAQVGRLKYLLSHGVKELLVDRPGQWPGVHCVEALLNGTPLVGHWYDRSREYAARQLRREKDVDPEQFKTQVTLEIEPLPCWVDRYTEEEIRGFVTELVNEIEEEGVLTRRETGKRSLGVKKILRMRPHHRPADVKKSPKPRFHAVSREAFQLLREAYQAVVGAFREASDRLLAGHHGVVFPEGTFPPAQAFVPFAGHVLMEARGQP